MQIDRSRRRAIVTGSTASIGLAIATDFFGKIAMAPPAMVSAPSSDE